MTALQQIREMRAWAHGRYQACKEHGARLEAACWEVKRDTYDTVIKILEGEERDNNGSAT